MVRKIVLLAIALIVLTFGYFAYQLWLRQGGSDEVIVRIPEGSSFSAVLDSLESNDIIDSRTAFRILAVTTKNDGKIRPGVYKFKRGTPGAELLDALVEGRSTVRERVTFPEGITLRRIASIASAKLGTDSAEFMRLAGNREFLKTVGINAATAEGYLMPDTYFLYWGEQPADLIRRMSDEFKKFYTDSLKALAAGHNLSPYEAIVLASIVEGEARVDEDRAIVAGVYHNRLKKGMMLQADPTIQYILPDGPRRLFEKDLKIDSPYNTYRYTGLPPTPINNPGRKSILATLTPDKNDYIYFVAKADGSGRHTFSRTAAEHEAAVREYRRNVAAERREENVR